MAAIVRMVMRINCMRAMVLSIKITTKLMVMVMVMVTATVTATHSLRKVVEVNTEASAVASPTTRLMIQMVTVSVDTVEVVEVFAVAIAIAIIAIVVLCGTNSITFGNITGGLISIHNDLVTSSSNDNITFTKDEFFGVDDNAPDTSLYDENSASDPNANISFDWIFLFAPLPCICFPIYFKVGYRETIPAFFVSLLSLSMTLIITEFNNAMLGSFVAAFVTSLASHVWSRGWHGCYCLTSRQWLRVENYNNKSSNQKKFRYKHKVDIHPPYRPESIVGIPTFFALAGGSLGK